MNLTAQQWAGLIRILFGLIWVANFILQANAVYLTHFLSTFDADWVSGQPEWLAQYGHSMVNIIHTIGEKYVGMVIIALDAVLAISLLSGVGLRVMAWVGIIYNLWLWSTVGGLGGPYTQGATDPGTAIIYVLCFLFVLITRSWEKFSFYKGKITDTFNEAGLLQGRILFGLLWAFDAFWKWHPYFLNNILSYLEQAQQGQPAWIITYIGFFIMMIKFIGPVTFAVFAALAESAIAISLLTGLFLSYMLPLGAIYSLVLWSTAEGWGGPYALGVTGNKGAVLGTANIYVVVFLFLMTSQFKRKHNTA